MCFGWAGAYHRSVEDWSSSVWTGKKDGFELQDDTSFSWESAGFLVAGLAKERHGHEHGRNSMTPWAIGHHIGCFIIRKSGKKQLFLWPQAVKAKDYGEIRRRFVFFFAGASPCKHGVFLKPWAWGRQKCPQIQDLPKMEWWFGSRNWKMGHLASEVEAIAVGPWVYQADKSDDDMPKLSVALTSKELTETYWDTCHASVAGETGGRGVHLAWVKTLRWFFAEDSQINWMIDWATLMAAIFPLLQKIGGRRLVATKSAEAR